MLVLGIDTSTPATSVAVVRDDRVLADHSEVAANRHGELLAPLVRQALHGAGVRAGELDLIAVGVGPGPYTGLRVGIITALAMADATGVPAAGVGSLDAVAHALPATDADRPWASGFVVATDARRREVYWAIYARGQRSGPPSVGVPADVARSLDPTTVVGTGALLYADTFASAGHVVADVAPYPSAVAIARLATDPAYAVPVRPLYLRRPDARPPGAPKRVSTP